MKDEKESMRLMNLIMKQIKTDLHKIKVSAKSDSDYNKKVLLYTSENPVLRKEYKNKVDRFNNQILKVLEGSMKMKQ